MPNQPLTITATYTPGNPPTLSCSPSSVTVSQGNTGVVTVNLVLATGYEGSLQFQNPPISWIGAAPPNVTIAPPNGGTGGPEVINVPNGNRSSGNNSYSFNLQVSYTALDGKVQNLIADPTIINEGI